jgi:hypothetical protein
MAKFNCVLALLECWGVLELFVDEAGDAVSRPPLALQASPSTARAGLLPTMSIDGSKGRDADRVSTCRH